MKPFSYIDREAQKQRVAVGKQIPAKWTDNVQKPAGGREDGSRGRVE